MRLIQCSIPYLDAVSVIGLFHSTVIPLALTLATVTFMTLYQSFLLFLHITY
jgi:hypothetical protein